MTGNCEARVSDDGNAVWCRMTWKIDLENRTGGELTEAQKKALIEYCETVIPKRDIAPTDADSTLIINASEIRRHLKHSNTSQDHRCCYDADTGKVYGEKELFDGHYEIRVTPTDDHENGENSTKVDLQ